MESAAENCAIRGKRFFLKLASEVAREVNGIRYRNGFQYARKATTMTGMSLNLNGLWVESQLTEDLQHIISKHRSKFNGEPINVADIETDFEYD